MRLAFLGILCACTASSSEVSPPRYDLYYPTSVVISPAPGQTHLFILNANSDLRYDTGTIQVIDLDRIDAAEECTPDERVDSLVNCPTTLANGQAAPFMVQGATVKAGNFGSAIDAQLLDNGNVRLFATIRGDPSIIWADFDGGLNCGGSGDLPRCGEDHRLDVLLGDPTIGTLPPEPFVLYADGAAENVFVTHLTSGQLTLVHAPRGGGAPLIHDTMGGLFLPNSSGSLRAVGVAAREPGNPDGLVYVTSSSEARVATVHVVPGPVVNGTPVLRLASGQAFFYGNISTPGLSADSRGIAFEPGGGRAFMVSRLPAELVVVDTSDGPTGAPKNEVVGAVEICAQSSSVVLADFGTGMTAWLPCFGTGQVWVVDVDAMRLEAVIDAGRGPNAIAVDVPRARAYVANYAEDTITVIDADPMSPSRYGPIFRLGKRRLPE